MAQRNSGYARIGGDTYVTPRWVYEALYSVEPWARTAFDPAPVNPDFDFLDPLYIPPLDDIATNPPFSKSEAFCRKALKVAKRVALLLPYAWDTANRRRDLFERGPFKAKYVLTKRIRWENLEQKKNGPSTNHAWYVWDDVASLGPPMIGWLP